MCLAAAFELAAIAEENGIHEEYIVPKMDDWEIYPREAVAVGLKAMKQGISGLKCSIDELTERSYSMVMKARNETYLLMKKGVIARPPEEESFKTFGV